MTEKWFICSFYNPKCSLISYHLSKTKKHLGILTSKNDNIILMRDFNAEPNTTLLNFYGIYNLKNLINFFFHVKSENIKLLHQNNM